MNQVFSYIIVLCLVPLSTNAQFSSARAMADSLLKQCGGKNHWAQVEMIQVQETTWFQQLNEPVIQTITVDLRRPRVRFQLKSSSMDRVRAFTISQGWGLLENGRQYTFDQDRLASDIAEWNSSLYRILHLVATSGALVLEKQGDNRLLIHHNHRLLAWIDLSPEGRPLRFGKDDQYHVYGPLEKFGPFRLPKWGVQEDGSWNFEYISIKSVPANSVNFDPP